MLSHIPFVLALGSHICSIIKVLDVHVMSAHVEVRRLNGDPVCVIENVTQKWCADDLKQRISMHSGLCWCKIVLIAGKSHVRLRTPMSEILEGIKHNGTIRMIEKKIVVGRKGFCLSCMLEAGMTANNILEMADSRAMREAGFLKCLMEGGVSAHRIYTMGKYVNVAAVREAGFTVSPQLARKMDGRPRDFVHVDSDIEETEEVDSDIAVTEEGYADIIARDLIGRDLQNFAVAEHGG